MWFNFLKIFDKPNRQFGLTVRFLGIDFSVVVAGWINDWVLVDLRVPANYGIFTQVLCLSLSVGRLPNDYFQNNQG